MCSLFSLMSFPGLCIAQNNAWILNQGSGARCKGCVSGKLKTDDVFKPSKQQKRDPPHWAILAFLIREVVMK
jgi:hypothetical protein